MVTVTEELREEWNENPKKEQGEIPMTKGKI